MNTYQVSFTDTHGKLRGRRIKAHTSSGAATSLAKEKDVREVHSVTLHLWTL